MVSEDKNKDEYKIMKVQYVLGTERNVTKYFQNFDDIVIFFL